MRFGSPLFSEQVRKQPWASVRLFHKAEFGAVSGLRLLWLRLLFSFFFVFSLVFYSCSDVHVFFFSYGILGGVG